MKLVSRHLFAITAALSLLAAPTFASVQRQIGEYFAVSSLHYVGLSLGRALIKADGAVRPFEVDVGDYLGPDSGKITSITQSSIVFVEIVPDGVGGWVERKRQLPYEPPHD